MSEQGDPGLSITRVFEAPRERVWREWTTPEAFADWFGAPTGEIPVDTVEMDVREGGSWKATMFAGEERRRIDWLGEYLEVAEPERLVLTMTDRPGPERELVTVVLSDLGDGRTEMLVEQRGGMAPEQYERAGQGWSGFLDRIESRLGEGG